MSATGYSAVGLAEAAEAIQKEQAHRAGKGEQFLNTLGQHICYCVHGLPNTHLSSLGDKALAVSGSGAVSTIKNLAGSAAFDTVKEQVSHFTENSKVLVSVLGEVGKMHPFIHSVLFSPCVCCSCVLIYSG